MIDWDRVHQTIGQGGTDEFSIPVRNDRRGRLTVGDQRDSSWAFRFPPAAPITPPTRVHIPGWIFERTERARRARSVFRALADLEFNAHPCDRCGDEHRIIARQRDRLVDLPCCRPGE